MYRWNNPNDVNMALDKTGSQFRVDENGMQPTYPTAPAAVSQPVVPTVDVQTAQPTPPPQQGADPLPPNPYETEPENPEKNEPLNKGWNDLGGAISAMGDNRNRKQNEQMKKVGTLVGTVLSFYTGNYAGGAKGAQSMGEQAK